MNKITKDMTIHEIFLKFPEKQNEIAEIFSNAGLGCMGCAHGQFETLEQGLHAHGKTDSEINKVLSDLNSVI